VRNHFLRAATTAPAYVTDNLVFHIDAGNINSYSGSGTTVNSLVGNITNSSYNQYISHSSSDGGYWSFDTGGSNSTGNGIEFNSVTSFMPLGSSDMTYEIWTKIKATSNSPFGLIRTLSGGSEGFNFFILSYSNRLVLFKDGFVSNFQTSANSVLLTGATPVWRHFVITHDTSTSTAKVYINGSLDPDSPNIDTTNWGAYLNSSDNQYSIRIGRGLSMFQNESDVSIVRFYKGKVLTATEVTQNYNAEKARYGY
tara:strand:+ start:18 stop:779 length:762 start_codon:yes stop_codon:yes gene_type:complete